MGQNTATNIDRDILEEAPEHGRSSANEIRPSRSTLSASYEQLREFLSEVGLDFEGRTLPVSLYPTTVDAGSLIEAGVAAERLHGLLCRLIDQFLTEQRSGVLGPISDFYSTYQRYFPLIAAEQRKSGYINLMRFDALEPTVGSWKMLETNTHCPGGVIHCAYIRQAWLETELGQSISRSYNILDFPIDSPFCFVMHALALAQQTSGKTNVTVALANYKNVYSNELESLCRAAEALREAGITGGSKFILCDIRDLSCDRQGRAFVGEEQIHLIYNKINPLMIEPGNSEIRGWFEAAESDQIEFLNSLGASFLTETKRTLAALHHPAIRDALGLTAGEIELVDRYVPRTALLVERGVDQLLDQLLSQPVTELILKPDALTRGSGIVIGREVEPERWNAAVDKARPGEIVVQEFVAAPSRTSPEPATLALKRWFYGIDLFLFAGTFVGGVSRCHQDRVMNVGNNGQESPLVAYMQAGDSARTGTAVKRFWR